MSEEIKEILDKLNKTADNPLFVICSSQKELDKIPKYTANFLSVNDRQAKLLLNYITNLQQKVEEKDKEIDRLNNIIDKQDRDITTLTKGKLKLKNIITKLEKWLLSEQKRYRDYLSTRLINDSEYNSKYATQSALLQLDVVLDKLKELKENK